MLFSRLLLGTILLAGPALAETKIAIIDSGVDYKHKDLAGLMWHDSGTDSEYPDDTNGWNFADNNNQVIDYSYLGTFPADVPKYFAIQGKKLLGTATQEELDWMTAHRADEAFVVKLETFGNFVHGTHVTGISTDGNPNARAIPIKMIATKPPGTLAALSVPPPDGANDFLIMFYLGIAANNNLSLVAKTAVYADKKGAKVANCSFGASVTALKPTITNLLKQLNNGAEPTPEDVRKWTLYLLKQLNDGSDKFVGVAPNTLFVIASGNDGTNNDVDPAWPANAQKVNTISVAATLGTQSLATFSNYGEKMVDVAAPGVVINSTIPGDEHLELSGTSMAAPFVTDAAGMVADANPALTPAQVKAALIGTVDKKDFLQGKVASGGIVNKTRAVKAALLAAAMPLKDAIAQARLDVADIKATTFKKGAGDVVPVALPNPIR